LVEVIQRHDAENFHLVVEAKGLSLLFNNAKEKKKKMEEPRGNLVGAVVMVFKGYEGGQRLGRFVERKGTT